MLKKGKQFFILLGLSMLTIGLFAQQGNNPFEVPGRTVPAENKHQENVTSSSDENPFEVNSDTATQAPAAPATTEERNNPFEIKKTIFSDTKKSTLKPVEKRATTSTSPLSGKFKLWMTILLITILTVLVNLYQIPLGKVYRSFLNNNFLKMVHRDYGTVSMIPYLVLYVFSLILIGVFIFVVFDYYKITFFSAPILDLLACVGGIFAIFIVKHLALQIIGSIFPIAKEIEQYSFTIIIFGIIIGLFLLPAILLISYAPPELTITLIYGTFIAIALVYLYRILRSLFIGLKYISLHKFHFFVYLCTIEIAPLLVLLKLATTA